MSEVVPAPGHRSDGQYPMGHPATSCPKDTFAIVGVNQDCLDQGMRALVDVTMPLARNVTR
jgi:hypothetical protein